MASDEDTKSTLDENFEWNVENEIHLFEAMIGHKPVGINKHFHMACISEKFESLIGRSISSDVIWKHLESMFDLAALDKKDTLPFPNEPEEFSLPEAEYSDLINEKLSSKTESSGETKENTKEEKISAKVVKDSTPAKESASKKESRKSEVEDTFLSNEGEKKETIESETETKKGKSQKEEKPVKTRGKRNAKEKAEEETPKTPGNKKEEESSPLPSSNKKEKLSVGKRTLRSRADDSLSNKSLTPPPIKRARRI